MAIRIRRAETGDLAALAGFGLALAHAHVDLDDRRFVVPAGGVRAFLEGVALAGIQLLRRTRERMKLDEARPDGASQPCHSAAQAAREVLEMKLNLQFSLSFNG